MKKKHSNQPEEIAKQLKLLSTHQSDKRALLHTTLTKIDTSNTSQNLQENHLLDSSQKQSENSDWFIKKVFVYAPLTAVALVVVFGSLVFMRNRPQNSTGVVTPSNVGSHASTVANGTIENVVTALSADVVDESTQDQQVFSEGQTTTNDVAASAQLIGDTSNDTSF